MSNDGTTPDDSPLEDAMNGCGATPKLNPVQNPAKLGWEPIVRVEHYHVGANAILEAARD